MHLLKLPEYSPKIRRNEIFCLIRKKWVVLLPEEWVRQHFLNLLINHLSYPKGLIKLEHSIQYFKNAKRSDITVLDKEGNVFLLVECKSFKVNLNQSVVSQLSAYNKVLDAKYLSISNGMKHFIWERKADDYIAITEFPVYK